MTLARFLMVTIILVYDSQLNRPESVSLASLARQLWYVQFLFLKPVKKAERNFEIAVGTLCLLVRRYASLYSSGKNPASQATFHF